MDHEVFEPIQPESLGTLEEHKPQCSLLLGLVRHGRQILLLNEGQGRNDHSEAIEAVEPERWISQHCLLGQVILRNLGQPLFQALEYEYGIARSSRTIRESFSEAHQYKFHLRSEEHTSELQSLRHLVCRLLLEKKKHP